MKCEDQKSFCWVVVKSRTVSSGWSEVYRKMFKPFLCISILAGVALWVWVLLRSYFDRCHCEGHPHCPSDSCMYGYISNNDTWSHIKNKNTSRMYGYHVPAVRDMAGPPVFSGITLNQHWACVYCVSHWTGACRLRAAALCPQRWGSAGHHSLGVCLLWGKCSSLRGISLHSARPAV